MLLIILIVGILAIAGGIAAWLTEKPSFPSAVSLGIIGLVTGSFAVAALSYPVAHHVAQRGAIGGFHQFLNGSIVAANVNVTNCHRDGSCVHEYDCDPYQVAVQKTRSVPDGKGGTKTETYTDYETRYHQCPRATQEFTYTVTDSLGNGHTIASHIFAANPQRWRYDAQLGGTARGVPMLWQQMKDGVDQGNLYPITLTSTYDNYILADQSTILKEHSDDITRLKQQKLLPDHTQNMRNPIINGYSANKVSFVGFQPANASAWQQTLMSFNAALGMTYQGDMHVVAIKASALQDMDPHNYLLALKAYWLNDLGKYALPKNGIMLVLGVDDSGSNVLWSQADTGMPVGNGAMLSALSDLGNRPFTTDALFGTTTAHATTISTKTKAAYTLGTGKVTDIVMNEFPFARACMKCTSKADAGKGTGFTYLSTDLPVPMHIKVWTIVIDLFILAIIWGVCVYFYMASTSTSYRGTPSLYGKARTSILDRLPL